MRLKFGYPNPERSPKLFLEVKAGQRGVHGLSWEGDPYYVSAGSSKLLQKVTLLQGSLQAPLC